MNLILALALTGIPIADAFAQSCAPTLGPAEQESWSKEVANASMDFISGRQSKADYENKLLSRELELSKNFLDPERSAYFETYYLKETIPGFGYFRTDRNLNDKQGNDPFSSLLQGNPKSIQNEIQGHMQRLWKLAFIKRRITDTIRWGGIQNQAFRSLNQSQSTNLFGQVGNSANKSQFKRNANDPLENPVPGKNAGLFSSTPPQYYPTAQKQFLVQHPIGLDAQLKGVNAEIAKVRARLFSVRKLELERTRKLEQEFVTQMVQMTTLGDYIVATSLTQEEKKLITSMDLTAEQYLFIEASALSPEQLGIAGAPASKSEKLAKLLRLRNKKLTFSTAIQNRARRLGISLKKIDQYVRITAPAVRPYFEELQKHGAVWRVGAGWNLTSLHVQVDELRTNKKFFYALANQFSPSFASRLSDPRRKVAITADDYFFTPPSQSRDYKGKIRVYTAKKYSLLVKQAKKQFDEAADQYLKASAERFGAADQLADIYLNSFWSVRLPNWFRYINPIYAAYDASRNAMIDHQYSDGKREPEVRMDDASQTMIAQVKTLQSLGIDSAQLEPFWDATSRLAQADKENAEEGYYKILAVVAAEIVLPIGWEASGAFATLWAGEGFSMFTGSVLAGTLSSTTASGITASLWFSAMPGLFSFARSAIVAIPKSMQNGSSWSCEAFSGFVDQLPDTLIQSAELSFLPALAPASGSAAGMAFGSVQVAKGVYATVELSTALYFAGQSAQLTARDYKPCTEAWAFANRLKSKNAAQSEIDAASTRAYTKCTELGFDATATVLTFVGAKQALKTMKRASPQGGEWFRPVAEDLLVDPLVKKAQSVDLAIEKINAKLEADGKGALPQTQKTTAELIESTREKPTSITERFQTWLDGITLKFKEFKENPQQSIADLAPLKNYIEKNINEHAMQKLEHAVSEINLNKPNSMATKRAWNDIAEVLMAENNVQMQKLFAHALKRGWSEVIREIDAQSPAPARVTGTWMRLKSGADKAVGQSSKWISKESLPVFKNVITNTFRFLTLKFDIKRIELISKKVDLEFQTKGFDAAYDLYLMECKQQVARENLAGKLDKNWHGWMKDTWNAGTHLWVISGFVNTWKNGYSSELSDLEAKSKEIAREISKDYRRDLFLNDLCQAWLATYVKETPSDEQVTAALQGFVQVADEVGTSAGQPDSRSTDTKISEAREIFEKVRHQQQK